MKKQTTILMSKLTRSQVDWLRQSTGENITEIISRSIEIYYQMMRREHDEEDPKASSDV